MVERSLEPSGSGGLSLCVPASTLERRARVREDTPAVAVLLPLRPSMKKRVVRAEEVEVVDEVGHVRMRIGLSNDDTPFFSMLDADGSVRARFGVQADGA